MKVWFGIYGMPRTIQDLFFLGAYRECPYFLVRVTSSWDHGGSARMCIVKVRCLSSGNRQGQRHITFSRENQKQIIMSMKYSQQSSLWHVWSIPYNVRLLRMFDILPHFGYKLLRLKAIGIRKTIILFCGGRQMIGPLIFRVVLEHPS